MKARWINSRGGGRTSAPARDAAALHCKTLRALPVILGNCIIIAGIVIAILTAKDNIFSAPEFSPGRVDGKTWGHAVAHVVAMIVLPLILWAVGSLIMLVTKKLTGRREQRGGAAG